MKGGGRREKRSVGEHCWGRFASLLQAFGQRTKSIKKRSVDGEKVLKIIKNFLCEEGECHWAQWQKSKMENQSAVVGVVHARSKDG